MRPVTRRRRRRALAGGLLVALALLIPAGTAAEQATQPTALAAGQIDVSGNARDSSGHTCVRLTTGSLRCWGFGGAGRLGYASTLTVGDDETPGAIAPISLGLGRTATAVTAGFAHTCALLDDGTVRCWGFGGDGRLGYGNQSSVGDDETPGAVGPVDLGAGRTATAIAAGQSHTCAVLDDGTVRCWGFGNYGELGYGNSTPIGDDEKPSEVAPVRLGAGRTATAITAGYGDTCALLDDGTVRCWGFGSTGRLGYGNTETIGDNETPDTAGPVNLGAGHTAKAISAGDNHTCAILDDDTVRCWGYAGNGRLGYGNTDDVGDNEAPGTLGPVNLGAGRTAKAISAGSRHTCAVLDDGTVRCWGEADTGRLGYCNRNDIGDDETPGSVGPANVTTGSDCSPPAPGASEGGNGAGAPLPPAPPTDPQPAAPARPSAAETKRSRYLRALAAEKRRKRALRRCLLRSVRRDARRSRRAHGRAPRRALKRRRAGRRRCLRRYERTPGRVQGLRARRASATKAAITFRAPGTSGSQPPAARSYVLKQSTRRIRRARAFRRAPALCRGTCRFSVTYIGSRLEITVTDLRRHETYYYAVAARDNVTGRHGRRSHAVEVKPITAKRS